MDGPSVTLNLSSAGLVLPFPTPEESIKARDLFLAELALPDTSFEQARAVMVARDIHLDAIITTATQTALPLLAAAINAGNIRQTELLLLLDADPTTALSLACDLGAPTRIVEAIAEKMAGDIDRVVDGYTPLHLATQRGFASIATSLIHMGADIDIMASNGGIAYTTLHLSILGRGLYAMLDVEDAYGLLAIDLVDEPAVHRMLSEAAARHAPAFKL
ncbi:hypothetical protein HDU98_008214 [Podochytrium sp. JEL0797]|nr:hypothetical protein HDU98_008214 [Podochytrium sp. JEL0797]